MNAKNLVILTGRLTRDIELRATQSGVPVTRFSVAVNRPKKSGEDSIADFINILAWRQSAEFASKFFHKGDPITVVGSIQTGNYTDNEGQTRNSFEVVADSIDFPLTRTKQNAQGGFLASQGTVSSANVNVAENSHLEDQGNEDDLPF